MTKQRKLTRKDLAELYGCSRRTITRILQDIGIMHHKKLSESEINLVYSTIGTPEQAERIAKIFNVATTMK